MAIFLNAGGFGIALVEEIERREGLKRDRVRESIYRAIRPTWRLYILLWWSTWILVRAWMFALGFTEISKQLSPPMWSVQDWSCLW